MKNTEQRINALEAIIQNARKEIEELKKFEVGKWHKGGSFLICPTDLTDVDNAKGYGFNNGIWTDFNHFSMNGIYKMTSATELEVFQALTKEAIKIGFKVGVKVRRSQKLLNLNLTESADKDVEIYDNCFDYEQKKDSLSIDGRVIYCKGVWAEIIKEEPIKIGGYECIVDECGAYFDSNQYSWEELESLIKIFENHSSQLKSINVGCTGQYKIDLEMIKKIYSLKPLVL